MLSEATDKIRNRWKTEFKCNISYRKVRINKQPLGLFHHLALNILFCAEPHGRGYHLIEIVRSNAELIRIILNRMLLFCMCRNQIHEFTYMIIENFPTSALLHRNHFKISTIQQHQDFIKQCSQNVYIALLIRINLHLYIMQGFKYACIKLIRQM